MKRSCPNLKCLSHQISKFAVRDGSYFRPSDGRLVQRFRCLTCGKRFSAATFDPRFGQKKRRVNASVKMLLSSGNSMRRIAFLLSIHRTTVARKLKFLGAIARKKQIHFLRNISHISSVQFDELVTIERTKCLPVAVALMVESEKRKILGFEVSPMPANGPLAAISREKYGFRKDFRRKGLNRLFDRVSPYLDKDVKFISDAHPYYPPIVKKFFPNAEHVRTKGRRGCVVGQGELKRVGFDPLFSLNHTCAMLRANINRLVRRTWCTTKSLSALADHIAIYVDFHNQYLTKKIA